MNPVAWLTGYARRIIQRAQDEPSVGRRPRLLVDLSTIAQHDAGTGIQRVVRALWLQLRDLPDIDVVPVAATVKRGYCRATIEGARISLPAPDAALLEIGRGDLFLGLDLAAHRLWRHRRQLARWKRRGALMGIMVYDVLPLRHADWFPPSTVRHFGRWIRVIERYGDVALCISQSVADDLDAVLEARRSPRRGMIARGLVPLSGDVDGSNPSMGIDAVGQALIARMGSRRALLMVATIEPRKAHDVMLAAFDELRRRLGEGAPDLVLVGRPGWRTEALQERLATHALNGAGLFWLADASDELLTALYARAALVVVPSLGEGFGLPIVEARKHGRKVLARDIPVFRELTQPGIAYFASDAPGPLADALLAALADPDLPVSGKGIGWADSRDALLRGLGLA